MNIKIVVMAITLIASAITIGTFVTSMGIGDPPFTANLQSWLSQINLATIPGCPPECLTTNRDICGYGLEIKYESYTGIFNWESGFTFTCPTSNWVDLCGGHPCWAGDYCRVVFLDEGGNELDRCNWMDLGDTCNRGPGIYGVIKVVWDEVPKECCDPSCTSPPPECQPPNCWYNDNCYSHTTVISQGCTGNTAWKIKCMSGTVEEWTDNCDSYPYDAYCENGRCASEEICGNGVCEEDTLGECTWCPQDCTQPECQGKTCGNTKCDWGETEATCPQDCAPEAICGDGKCTYPETKDTCPEDCLLTCYVKGSSCGVGFPYECCPGLICDYRSVITGVCIEQGPIQCQPKGMNCGWIGLINYGDCCEGLKCANGICVEKGPFDDLIEFLKTFMVVFLIAIVLLGLLVFVIPAFIPALGIFRRFSSLKMLLVGGVILAFILWFIFAVPIASLVAQVFG